MGLPVCGLVDEIAATVTRTGGSVTLGCVINTSERIRADIAWYKDDRQIRNDERFAISRNETRSSLNISQVCEFHTHTHV